MKTLKILTGIMLVAAMICGITTSAFAETRTLTTTVVITIKSPGPAMPNAPQSVRETLTGALTQSGNEQFVKFDGGGRGVTGAPSYTMMEKL